MRRLTLCVKFSSGEFGKILPPPRHSGLEVMPARARPVPFWRQGFLVEWLTAPRSFCAREPILAFAWKATTIWCTSAWLKSRPKISSFALRVPAAPVSLIILSSMAASALRRRGLHRGLGFRFCRRLRGLGLGGLGRGLAARALGPGWLDRRAHEHIVAARAGHRALDEQ